MVIKNGFIFPSVFYSWQIAIGYQSLFWNKYTANDVSFWSYSANDLDVLADLLDMASLLLFFANILRLMTFLSSLKDFLILGDYEPFGNAYEIDLEHHNRSNT